MTNNYADNDGGGMYNILTLNFDITNCIFSNNEARHGQGGAIRNVQYSSPTIDSCSFINNISFSTAGIHNGVFCNTILKNCHFDSNMGIVVSYFNAQATINNCIFENNMGICGGVYISHTSTTAATIENCIFRNNTGYSLSGALYLTNNLGPSPLSSTIKNCVFSGNSISDAVGGSGFGGAAVRVNDVNPTFINCLFTDNLCNNCPAGAIRNVNTATTILINCTIVDNISTSNGIGSTGGIFNASGTYSTLQNCILWNNGAQPIYNSHIASIYSSYTDVYNSIIQGSGGSTNWDIDVGQDMGGNLDINPSFENTNFFNYHLRANSPAINAGLNSFNTISTDLQSNSRIVGTAIDMGCYEYGSTHQTASVHYTVCLGDTFTFNGVDYTIPTSQNIYIYNIDEPDTILSFNLSWHPTVQIINNQIAHVSGSNLGNINITLSGDTSSYSYQWSNGATTQDIYQLDTGYYQLTVIDTNGCSFDFDFNISFYANNTNLALLSNIETFPNPVIGSQALRIISDKTLSKPVFIEFTNSLGQVIGSQEYSLMKGENFIDVPNVHGLVFLNLIFENRLVKTFKILLMP